MSASRLLSASSLSQLKRRMSAPAAATAKIASTAWVTTQKSGIAHRIAEAQVLFERRCDRDPRRTLTITRCCPVVGAQRRCSHWRDSGT